ncbi:MAG TPA: methyltransferase domain-containing protein [Oligoflexus sp.]|uniref:methyltransferase domain-containing protein n=1 Tax=Oligoflexus sp. TaxID=1971216 RepID=UPI002D6F1B12|nr:methyltransferase domain-containing protein [Oligoflexus sp.]HYX32163.1 methyltransferase domain-containing protein [Oligoflexus sp.]
MSQDRNFDEIFDRFQARIKTNKKGLIREALIREDLHELVLQDDSQKLSILDSGCGLGDMSMWLAQKGHQVLATDISARMVEHTSEQARQLGLDGQLTARQQTVQDALRSGQTFDLICIHAVLEWLHEPYDVLPLIPAALNPGGRLSLTIYNRHRSVFNSLVKGEFKRILVDDYAGSSNAMTPPNPIEPEKVCEMLQSVGMKMDLQAGLRCFYDYFPNKVKDEHSVEDILILERRYRRVPPYRDIARYVHFIAHKV